MSSFFKWEESSNVGALVVLQFLRTHCMNLTVIGSISQKKSSSKLKLELGDDFKFMSIFKTLLL